MKYGIMKLLTFVFFLFSTYNLSAQSVSPNNGDTTFKANRTKISAERLKRSLNLSGGRSPLYVLNDKLLDDTLVDRILGNVDAADILEIKVLKDSLAPNVYTQRPPSPIVLVTTIAYAQKEYQKKLYTFSKKYKDYLEAHQNKDKDILYVLDGVLLNATPMTAKENEDMTKKLYEIPAKRIKKVRYSDNFLEGMKNGATIFITTRH